MPLTIDHFPASRFATPAQRAFDQRISTIVANKLPVFFLSPHLDDAVLSAGGIIAHLAKRTSVTILTVFTEESPPPYSPFARQCLGEAGYEDAKKYFADRRAEDARVCKIVGVDFVHLGFTDAPWRRINTSPPPPTNFIPSPGRRGLSEVFDQQFLYAKSIRLIDIHIKDIHLIARISEKIDHIIKDHSSSVVFGPLAIGRHVDHLITREALVKTISTPIFWSDFPYNATDTPDPMFLATHHLQPALWTNNQEEKTEGIKGYQTQMKSLFPDGNILLPLDKYFLRMK